MSIKSQSNSNEELLIRALVDDIYQIEEKINSIYEQISKNSDQSTIIKKIEDLKLYRNNLIQKKINLNESFLSEIKNNSDEIEQKFNLIKEIEDNITYMKNELISNFNTLSFQCIKLKKIILSNKSSDFLSEKQINEIIFDTPSSSSNSDIQKLKREIEINKASESVIINNYNEINSKIAQIEENLKMLKEEKMTIKYELINLISCKESLESIIKLNINQLNIHNKISIEKSKNKSQENDDEENSLRNNNIWTKPSELFIYELMVIDSHKAAKNICDQLFNVFNITVDEENPNLVSTVNFRNKKKNNKSNYFKSTDENFNTYNNFKYQNKSVNELTVCKKNNNFSNDNNNDNENDNDFNDYNSVYFKYNYIRNINNNILNNSMFNKDIITSFIQNEIDKFSTGDTYSYKTISEFLENLSIMIISKFQYANIIISADTLTIYLSYSFKSLYYDSIINSKLKFINKDYKAIKKNYKNLIPYLYAESTKLDTKYHEYKSKTKIIEKQIKLIQKELSNKINTKKPEKVKLTQEEQNYIQICSKANGLAKQKKNIQKIIKEYEAKKNRLTKENELIINKLNDEIKNIDNEIVKLSIDMKTQKNKANKDIDVYKKMINEKYSIIQRQLQIYKNKYGSNLDIYNRLINSINNTIKHSHTKQPLIIINNNNNINNRNIFSYDIKNDLNLKDDNKFETKDTNDNEKDLLSFPNDNYNENDNDNYNENENENDNVNNDMKNELNDDVSNDNKDMFSLGIDISTIDNQNNKSKDNSNISINNISNNQFDNLSNVNTRERNIKGIKERRKVSKALSNVDCVYKANPSSEYMKQTNQTNIKNMSHNKNKTFYNSSISGNISTKKKYVKKSKYKYANKNRNANNINSTSEKRYDKYTKFFTNYHKNDTDIDKILTYTNISNINNDNKQAYKSYSYINKSGEKPKNSHTIKKEKSNNFQNSITLKKLGLFSSKKEKESNNKIIINNNINNINNNNYNNFLDNQKMKKLSNTLQSLKDTITQRGKMHYQIQHINNNIETKNNDFFEKIKFLKKITFCYVRKHNNKYHKYNPLLNVSTELLCEPPYNFTPATISLSQIFNQIIINPINGELGQIEFNITDIENTVVSSKIKLIIEVHRNFRKYKESTKYKSIEKFINSQMMKHPQLTEDEIEKCAKNKNFNFSVIISDGRIIELIICSYEEFKKWINGLAFLIKNKNEIIQSIKDNNNINVNTNTNDSGNENENEIENDY